MVLKRWRQFFSLIWFLFVDTNTTCVRVVMLYESRACVGTIGKDQSEDEASSASGSQSSGDRAVPVTSGVGRGRGRRGKAAPSVSQLCLKLRCSADCRGWCSSDDLIN